MAMNAGPSDCSSGLSLGIFLAITTGGDPALGVNLTALTSLKSISHAIATAVVSHITSNAVVAVTGVTAGPGTAPGTIT